MSKVDVAIRFADVMKNRANHQSVSLPMICNDSETIFFYVTSSVPNGFVVNEIGNIYFRNLKTSHITQKEALYYFDDNEFTELTKSRNAITLTGNDALSIVDKYYNLHESLLVGKQGDDAQYKEILTDYLKTFSLLVPKSPLREIYYRIGRPMFDDILLNTGIELEL